MKGELNKHFENIKIVIIKRRNSKIHYCGGLLLCLDNFGRLGSSNHTTTGKLLYWS